MYRLDISKCILNACVYVDVNIFFAYFAAIQFSPGDLRKWVVTLGVLQIYSAYDDDARQSSEELTCIYYVCTKMVCWRSETLILYGFAGVGAHLNIKISMQYITLR